MTESLRGKLEEKYPEEGIYDKLVQFGKVEFGLYGQQEIPQAAIDVISTMPDEEWEGYVRDYETSHYEQKLAPEQLDEIRDIIKDVRANR